MRTPLGAARFRAGDDPRDLPRHAAELSRGRRSLPLPVPEDLAAAAAALGWPQENWLTTFQSRFGSDPWLQPYTDETVEALAAEGVKRIALVAPGFSADCLETLEELDVENRHYFMEGGGEKFAYFRRSTTPTKACARSRRWCGASCRAGCNAQNAMPSRALSHKPLHLNKIFTIFLPSQRKLAAASFCARRISHRKPVSSRAAVAQGRAGQGLGTHGTVLMVEYGFA